MREIQSLARSIRIMFGIVGVPMLRGRIKCEMIKYCRLIFERVVNVRGDGDGRTTLYLTLGMYGHEITKISLTFDATLES